MASRIRNAVVVLVLAQPMCAKPIETPPTPVVLRITTPRGAPVAGAEVRVRNSVVARSDETGAASLLLTGLDGESYELQVQCPAPMRSPPRPIVVRRLAVSGGQAEHQVRCEETRRTLLVAVRADSAPKARVHDGPNLPIFYLEREIGRTDSSGAAHVKIDADIHEDVELRLGTEGTKIHPQNPRTRFAAADHDEIREWAVEFTRDAPPKPKVVVKTGPRPF